jgi:hypothetical protein
MAPPAPTSPNKGGAMSNALSKKVSAGTAKIATPSSLAPRDTSWP